MEDAGLSSNDLYHGLLARGVISVVKNALRAVLLLLGIALLVLPGQGVLTILAGLVLLSFPGKRRLEVWLAGRESVHRGLDWIRRRVGRPPFERSGRGRDRSCGP